MPRNQKLTKVIAGRTIKAVTAEADAVVLVFDDDSSMKIRTAAPAAVSPGGKVKSVQEDETELKIEFEDGSNATFRLEDPAHPLLSGTRIIRWSISVDLWLTAP
jgi:hypothetical protein